MDYGVGVLVFMINASHPKGGFEITSEDGSLIHPFFLFLFFSSLYTCSNPLSLWFDLIELSGTTPMESYAFQFLRSGLGGERGRGFRDAPGNSGVSPRRKKTAPKSQAARICIFIHFVFSLCDGSSRALRRRDAGMRGSMWA